MIIEIPDDNSIVKWKMNDKEDWKSAEISDLIKVYEEKPQGDLISREALKGLLNEYNKHFTTFTDIQTQIILDIIDHAPTVEMLNWYKVYEDVKGTFERPKGEWIKEDNGKTTDIYRCSICGRSILLCKNADLSKYPFCHCGADMRGEV